MKTRRFTLRAVFAATLVVAIIASAIPTNAMPIAAIPTILWGVGVTVGLVWSGGRGRACLVLTTITGVVGSMAAVLFIVFGPGVSFGLSWTGPLCIIAFGGMWACAVAVFVRLIMEGFVLSDANPDRSMTKR